MVDEALLAQIANQVLGSSLDIDQDVGLLKFILSCFLSGELEACHIKPTCRSLQAPDIAHPGDEACFLALSELMELRMPL